MAEPHSGPAGKSSGNKGAHRPRKRRQAPAPRSMLTHQPAEAAATAPLGNPSQGGTPALSPSKPCQQQRTPLRHPVPVRIAPPSSQFEAAAAHASGPSAIPHQPLRRQRGRAQLVARPLRRLQGNGAPSESESDPKDASASALALQAARAAVEAALTPSNGRPSISALSAATLAAAGLGLDRRHGRHASAAGGRHSGRPPVVRTLAELERLYGGRRRRRGHVGRPDAAFGPPPLQPPEAVEAEQPISLETETGNTEIRCNSTPVSGSIAIVGTKGPELSWEWMIEGVLRQVVLNLDTPSSVVRFRQVCALSRPGSWGWQSRSGRVGFERWTQILHHSCMAPLDCQLSPCCDENAQSPLRAWQVTFKAHRKVLRRSSPLVAMCRIGCSAGCHQLFG